MDRIMNNDAHSLTTKGTKVESECSFLHAECDYLVLHKCIILTGCTKDPCRGGPYFFICIIKLLNHRKKTPKFVKIWAYARTTEFQKILEKSKLTNIKQDTRVHMLSRAIFFSGREIFASYSCMVIQFYTEGLQKHKWALQTMPWVFFTTLEPWSILRIQPIQVTKQWLHYVSSLD